MRLIIALLLTTTFSIANATDSECQMDQKQNDVIIDLFSKQAHIYSVLWWNDPKSTVIHARSFVINGHDSIPIFSSEKEGESQLTGSGHEKELVGIAPFLLASILQGKEYAILNPGGSQPIQFKTCILKPFINAPDA